MSFREESDRIFYSSHRVGSSTQPVELEASWRKGEQLGEAAPESLEFFLVERYCLYAASRSHLFRARIFHRPWELQAAELLTLRATMLEAQGLPTPSGSPLLHYSERQDVSTWPLQKIA